MLGSFSTLLPIPNCTIEHTVMSIMGILCTCPNRLSPQHFAREPLVVFTSAQVKNGPATVLHIHEDSSRYRPKHKHKEPGAREQTQSHVKSRLQIRDWKGPIWLVVIRRHVSDIDTWRHPMRNSTMKKKKKKLKRTYTVFWCLHTVGRRIIRSVQLQLLIVAPANHLRWSSANSL
jgi:hypothetical protein